MSLTAPSNSVIAAPATITLTAAATPGAGRRIVRVDFFQGTSRIGTDTSAPYSVTWSNVPRGNYILTATAIDSGGSVAVSSPVIIRVDTPPSVSLKSPANNAVFPPGATIPLTASASDVDEIVTKVEFFSGGTLLGTQFLAPYKITWNNVPAGRYTLTARATDLVGLTTTSAPVTITVNVPPTVAITSPANNALFPAPATVTVSATAADADGNVTQVEFFDGATPVGTVPTTPGSPTYNVTLANFAAGTHTLTARATDDQGVTTTSAAVAITVNPDVVQIYYIQTDHLNTPRSITDQAGNEVWRWDNTEPFGDSAANGDPSNTGNVFDFPLGLSNYYRDRETGTFYAMLRDAYDAAIGRFPQSDPIGLRGGLNSYAYAEGNPLGVTDPLGLMGFGGGGSANSGFTGWASPLAPAPAPYCDGRWMRVGSPRLAPFPGLYMIVGRVPECQCDWICRSCPGGSDILPDPIVGTHTTTAKQIYGGGTGPKSDPKKGDTCLCQPPGPQKGCPKC